MTTMTGSEYLARALRGYGLSHVFMVPTIAVRALAILDQLGVVGVSAHGEKAAAYMADGYARAANGPAVCMAQTIGSTNLAAGLRDAFMGSSPVIAITGGNEPSTRGRGVYQEIEDFPIYESLTKYNMQVDDIARLPELLRQAFREATSGKPGPVHLELQGFVGGILERSFEVSDADLAATADARHASLPPFRPRGDREALEAVATLLASSERPVIVAGGGVVASGGAAALAAFAERARVPVATSLTGKGLVDERGPLAVGVVGQASRDSANRTIERADLVLYIGTSVGSQVTDRWRLPATGTPVAQIDIEPVQLGRNYPAIAAVQADAASALSELFDLVGDVPTAREEWIAETARFVQEWRVEREPVLSSSDAPIRPERLCRELTEFLTDDAVLVVDTGHAAIWVGGYIDLRPSQSFLRAAGSLGWGLSAAIGAKAAVGEAPVVCFTGDGGFYYHLSEIETAARHGIAPIIVVNNNVSLGQDMRIFHSAWGGPDAITSSGDSMWRYRDVDIATVAAELGAWSIRVDDPEQLGPALEAASRAGRIAVIDVRTSADALPPAPYGGRDFYSITT